MQGLEMTNQVETREKLETELFNSNNFHEMFEVAARRQLVIQEHTILMGQFFSLLNLESLQELANKEQIGSFLDALIVFLEKDHHFTKNEKKKFLNGCENVLFLHSVMLGQKQYAQYLNNFRLDKSLYLNRNFLANRISEQNYQAIEMLLDYSENVTYESSKVLKMLYVSFCRDYEFIKRLIAKNNFDINASGDLGLNDNFKGSFLHALALMSDAQSNQFFANFIKDYGAQINFDLKFTDSQRELDINVFDLIINNEKLDATEKIARLTTILIYGVLSEDYIEQLSSIIIDDKIIARYYNDSIYEALFAHQSFNSSTFNREDVLNKLLSLDNSEEFNKLRKESNNTINPTSVVLDKFFRFSSPNQSINQKAHPLSIWIEANANNNNFSIDTLVCLLKNYKSELGEIKIGNFKMPIRMVELLKQAGLEIAVKKSIISKIFPKENANKERLAIEFDKKVEPVNNLPKSSQSAKEKPVVFNKALFLKIQDEELVKQVDSILVKASQFLTISKEASQDQQYIKEKLPKLLNTTVENYFKFMNENPVESRKNTLIQLKMLHKKTFDLLTKQLEK